MADYIVQESDGVSRFLLEDGTGSLLLELQAAAVTALATAETGRWPFYRALWVPRISDSQSAAPNARAGQDQSRNQFHGWRHRTPDASPALIDTLSGLVATRESGRQRAIWLPRSQETPAIQQPMAAVLPPAAQEQPRSQFILWRRAGTEFPVFTPPAALPVINQEPITARWIPWLRREEIQNAAALGAPAAPLPPISWDGRYHVLGWPPVMQELVAMAALYGPGVPTPPEPSGVTPGWPVKHWHGPLGEYPQTQWPDWDARKGYRLRLRDGRVIQVRDHLEFLRTGAHFIGKEATEAVNYVPVKKRSRNVSRETLHPTPETAELMNRLLLERGILEIDILINLLAVNRQMVLQDEADFLAVIGQML